jgi:hypothetical protein
VYGAAAAALSGESDDGAALGGFLAPGAAPTTPGGAPSQRKLQPVNWSSALASGPAPRRGPVWKHWQYLQQKRVSACVA